MWAMYRDQRKWIILVQKLCVRECWLDVSHSIWKSVTSEVSVEFINDLPILHLQHTKLKWNAFEFWDGKQKFTDTGEDGCATPFIVNMLRSVRYWMWWKVFVSYTIFLQCRYFRVQKLFNPIHNLAVKTVVFASQTACHWLYSSFYSFSYFIISSQIPLYILISVCRIQ
jgi:hypothetical protein